MGILANAETPIRRTVGEDGGSPPGMASGGNTGGGPRHRELGPVHQPREDGLNVMGTTVRMHLSDDINNNQRERRLPGHWACGGLTEDHIGRDKPPHCSGSTVSSFTPWFTVRPGDGDDIP